MKTNKKILAILIAAVLVITLLPSMAFAEGEELCVGGVMVDLVNGSHGEGWNYDPDSKTLALENATITEASASVSFDDFRQGTANIYSKNMDLNILLSGVNSVSGAQRAVVVSKGNLTINGSGSLTASSTLFQDINAGGELTISGCTVKTINKGIYINSGSVVIKNSEVTCQRIGGSSDFALISDGGVIIENSIVYASGQMGGIRAKGGSLTITNSFVKAIGGGFAVSANNNIKLEGCTITDPEGAAIDGGSIKVDGVSVSSVIIEPVYSINADSSLQPGPEYDYVESYKIEPESAMPGDSISVSISMASNYAAAGGKPARVYYKTETDSETEVDITDLKTEGVTVTGSFEMPKDNVTIYAEWAEPLKEYTVIWLNGDGKELDSKTYLEGESEPVTDKIPVKAEDDEYTYTFDKWDSGTVEGTVKTYKPLFNSSEKVKPEPEPEPEPEPQPEPEPVPEVKPVYWVSEGTDLTVSEDSVEGLKLTVHRKPGDDMTFSLFTGVEMDGKQLSSSDYTASSGSLKLTVKPSYIQGLKVGSHTLKVKFSDGEVTANVKVTEASDNPRTGDESGLWIWILIAVIAAGGIIAALLVYRKQSKRE